MVKNLPAMWVMQFWSLGQADSLEKEMATHSSILAWKIPWTKEPSRLQPIGLQRVRHDWTTNTFTFSSFTGSTALSLSHTFMLQNSEKGSTSTPGPRRQRTCSHSVPGVILDKRQHWNMNHGWHISIASGLNCLIWLMYYECLRENFLVFRKYPLKYLGLKGQQYLQFTLKWLRKIYTHMCMYMCVYIYIYTHTHIYREREVCVCVCVCVHMCIKRGCD